MKKLKGFLLFIVLVLIVISSRYSKAQVATPPNLPVAPASAHGHLTFVKTLFYNDEAAINQAGDGNRAFAGMTTWGNNGDKFIIFGEYNVSFAGFGQGGLVTQALNTDAPAAGGGLWTAKEDGVSNYGEITFC